MEQQYLDLLFKIKTEGTWKDGARPGMPRTLSLFGHQMRHNLSEGFPLLTTKKINFKHIVTELMWFMKGDTNIKFLIDNGCNIWNEDAYNYYKKVMHNPSNGIMQFETFINIIKDSKLENLPQLKKNYKLGDCGKQYGWLWRNWQSWDFSDACDIKIDQLKELLEGLIKNPMSRRHIITAWNPATLNDMALNACHALVQFNCRPLTEEQQQEWILKQPYDKLFVRDKNDRLNVNQKIVPKYYLDCQMYQRSADVFLGVPYNIASYALLTHLLAQICNMVPGEFVHTFGDVHIYEDHVDAVNEQLSRTPNALPKISIKTHWWNHDINDATSVFLHGLEDKFFVNMLMNEDITLLNYVPQPAIKAKLSTGLK